MCLLNEKDRLWLCCFRYLYNSVNKNPNMSGYAGSKAAVNHSMANLTHDFGLKVRINAVGPGATRTATLECVVKK